jgi:hypothetical protein
VAGGDAEQYFQFGGQQLPARQQHGEPFVSFDDDRVRRSRFAEQDDRLASALRDLADTASRAAGRSRTSTGGWLGLLSAPGAGTLVRYEAAAG